MRKILILLLILVSLLLAACGGQGESVVVPNDGAVIDGEMNGSGIEQDVPRIEATPTPPLPPTFTPSVMAHQGHLYLLPVSGADGSIQYGYKVRAGDSLTAICDMYNVSVQEVMLLNDISDANRIEVGELLIIPVEGS